MFLPRRLLALELRRNGCSKTFVRYQASLQKLKNNTLRIEFLENCFKAEIIPRFLKFRIPNNGCFDDRSVNVFQKKLLRKEIIRAKLELQRTNEKVEGHRNEVKGQIPIQLFPSIILYTRIHVNEFRKKQNAKLDSKLHRLSLEQERPLFNVHNTVRCYCLSTPPPKYVLETLSLGPRNAILEKFDKNDLLAELDELLRFCRRNEVSEDIMTDINVKTLAYVKRCLKQKNSRNIQMT